VNLRPSRSTPLVVSLAGLLAGLAFTMPAAAQSVTDGPTVVPDATDVQIGQRVRMTITGFDAPVVVMAVCGNEARRGSVDCDNLGSQARETTPDGTPTIGSVVVGAPPAPCPCIIRVTSDDNDEVAVAPITIAGHPIAEVVEPSEFVQPLVTEIDAVRVPGGIADRLRASLGGPLRYEVTVTIRNTATYAVESVRATARYIRTRYTDERAITIGDPGTLGAGAIWEDVVEVEVPALTIGEVLWRVEASGSGAPVIAEDATTFQPVGLYVVAVVLVLDALVLIWRFGTRRRRRRRERRRPPENPFLDDQGPVEQPLSVSTADEERRMPELVG
jgi:hypothetical protein